MSLPEESVAVNTLPEVTTIPTGKKLIFTDPDTNEGGSITLKNLTKQILQNLTSQTFALDQGNLTLLQALNQLNSKTYKEINISFLKNKMLLYKVNNIVTITYTGDTNESTIPKGELGVVGSVPTEYAPISRYIFLNIQISTAKIQLTFYSDGNITAYNYGNEITNIASCRYSGAYVAK